MIALAWRGWTDPSTNRTSSSTQDDPNLVIIRPADANEVREPGRWQSLAVMTNCIGFLSPGNSDPRP